MTLSVEQYSDQVVESSLLSQEDISATLAAFPKERMPKNGEELARELVRQKKLTKYQAEQIYSGKGKLLVLGNYVVLGKLGQGGMGVVLKAEHKRLKRLVALKVLSPSLVKTPDALKRFHREVEAAAKLRHPHVVATDDADEAKGIHFLVMEYVEGSDLSAFVKNRGPLAVNHAVQCILQAAKGLEYAHRQGVVHRDIKPANLLLDSSGNVKILDMGLARIEGDSGNQSELTNTGTVMGTIDFMAPEQAMSTKHADARSDMYSLGISLWYLMAGRCVYEGDTLMSKLLAHRDAPIPSLKSINHDISPSLDSIFRKMVAKQAEDRYASMSEVISELESFLNGSRSDSGAYTSIGLEELGMDSLYGPQGTTPSSTSMTMTHAVVELKKQSLPSQASEATVSINQLETAPAFASLTSPSPRSVPTRLGQKRTERKAAGPPWYRDLRVLLGGAGAAALLLIASVFYLSTPYGLLRVEILDPEVEMKVKGTSIKFESKDMEPVTLEAGEKKLVVTRGEFSFETESFSLKRGAENRIKVEWVNDNLVVDSDGKVIAKKSLPKRTSPASPSVAVTPTPSISNANPTTDIPSPPSASNSAALLPPNAPKKVYEGTPKLAVAPFDAERAREYQEHWASYLEVPLEFTNSIGMKFILIPPGEFRMGATESELDLLDISDPDPEVQSFRRELLKASTPPHSVKISRPFYMQTDEVLNGQFQKILGRLPPRNDPTQTEYPVIYNVELKDSLQFCNELSRVESKNPAYQLSPTTFERSKESNGYRLPTEAEWEYACRAGTTSLFFFETKGPVPRFFVRLNDFQTIARGKDAIANPFGLYDLYGGASEWCFDKFQPYSNKPAVDPQEDPQGGYATIRGGGVSANGGTDVLSINSIGRTPGREAVYAGVGRVVLPIEIKPSKVISE